MKYEKGHKLAYLAMTDRIGQAWLKVFDGRTEFYSAPYWDLLVGLWRDGGLARKTDALNYMKTIKSAHTAAKYVDTAIKTNLLLEESNPKDSRSKIVSIAPEMMSRIEKFLDVVVDQTLDLGEELSERRSCQ
jgi:hypothetical protein